jgi:hypothetical protein
MLSTQQIRMSHHNTTRLSSVNTKESRDWTTTITRQHKCLWTYLLIIYTRDIWLNSEKSIAYRQWLFWTTSQHIMLLQRTTYLTNKLISTLQMSLHLKAVIRLIRFKALCLTLKLLMSCLLKNPSLTLYTRSTQKFNLTCQDLGNTRSDLGKETLLLHKELLMSAPCLAPLHFIFFL